MLVASNQNIVEQVFTVTSPLGAIASIDAAVTSAGWTRIGSFENGYVYLLRSPQSLDARCAIWFPDDPGFSGYLAIQMMSSLTHLFTASAVYHVQPMRPPSFTGDAFAFDQMYLWANCCSLFLGQAGVGENEFYPRSFQGGVLYTAGDTAPTAGGTLAGKTSELWFAAGDDSGVSETPSLSLRGSYLAKRASICRNGLISSCTAGGDGSALQMQILRSAAPPLGSEWLDGFLQAGDLMPVVSDPLVIFGGVMYGSLWDAALASRPSGIEEFWTVSWHVDPTDPLSDVISTYWNNYTSARFLFGIGPDEGRLYSLLLGSPTTPVRRHGAGKGNYVY